MMSPTLTGGQDPFVAGKLRLQMTLRARGINDLSVLRAMERVPREQFVAPAQQPYAYDNTTLPMAHGQTLSAPEVVARMTAALEPKGRERVLEIGTGSGYQTAVLSGLVARVFTIERWQSLSELAVQRFAALGLRNVEAAHGDGYQGWPSKAPFDAVLVTCGAASLPEQLMAQVALGGCIVLPLADADDQSTPYRLRRLVRLSDGWEETDLGPVDFVPFVTGLPQRQGA